MANSRNQFREKLIPQKLIPRISIPRKLIPQKLIPLKVHESNQYGIKNKCIVVLVHLLRAHVHPKDSTN